MMPKRDTETGIRLQEFKKGEYLPIEPTDSMQTVLADGIHAIQVQIQSGRQAQYPNTPDGLQQFQEVTARYFDTIKTHNEMLEDGVRAMLPDVEGLCIFCGISRTTLMTYSRRGGAWTSFIEFVKDIICAAKKCAANDYRTPPVFTIFDLKCNHGYIEKSEVKLTTDRADEENKLLDEIDAAGLRWDDDLREYVPDDGE